MIDLRGFQRGLLLIVTLFVLSACAAASANTGSTPQQAAGAQPGVALPLVIKAQPTAIPTATNLPTATATATATPPPVWRFVVLGDTRTSGFDPPQVTKDIVAKASSANPEITLAVGDLILSKSTPTDVDTQWQNWRAAVQPLGKGASIPDWLLVTPGNHDVESAAWAIDRMAAAFPELPTNGPSGLELSLIHICSCRQETESGSDDWHHHSYRLSPDCGHSAPRFYSHWHHTQNLSQSHPHR